MSFTNKDDNGPRRGSTTSTTRPSSSTAPLMSASASTDSLTAAYNTMPAAAKRPSISRAKTSISDPSTSAAAANPTLSRPLATHAQTTATSQPALELTKTTTQPRPGLFKRITTTLDCALGFSSTSAASAQNNPPSKPSHWTDHAHRAALLKTWDDIHEAAASSSKAKYPRSVAGQLVVAEKSLVRQFPELGQGEVVLNREWMEYVLGVALRHPFCSEGKMMGRWEVLSGVGKVGGARAWGPW